MADSTFLTRVVLENFKSIAACDVRLGPLTFLVGRNGAGKSNFLDALQFVADALRTSFRQAVGERGSLWEVRCRSPRPTQQFGIRVEFTERGGLRGHYAFRVKILDAQSPNNYEIIREECAIRQESAPDLYFRVAHGKVESSLDAPPPSSRGHLYLPALREHGVFHEVFESLVGCVIYHFKVEEMRKAQPCMPAFPLKSDGSNVASVLEYLEQNRPDVMGRIQETLHQVVPALQTVNVIRPAGHQEVVFAENGTEPAETVAFRASEVSEGTLRALATLVALSAASCKDLGRVPLIGLEEPETSLHPAATSVLLDALRATSAETQIIVTSQSPELLDDTDIDPESIRAVSADHGTTKIAPVDEATRQVLRKQLYTPGEMLRLDQIQPDGQYLRHLDERPLLLFDDRPTS